MNIKPFKFSTDEDSKKVEYIYPTSKKIGITSLGITIEFLYYFDGKTNNNGYVYLEAKPYIEIASVKHRSFVEWLEICNDLGMILSIISGQVLACTSFQLKQINFKHNIIHVDEWISIRSKHAFHMFQKYDKSAFQFLISKQSIDSNFDKLINGSFVFVNKNRRILNNFIETLDHEIDEKWKFLKLVQLLEKIHRLLCKGKYMENKLYTDMTNKLKSSCDDLVNDTIKEKFKIILKNGNKCELKDIIYEFISMCWNVCQNDINDPDEFVASVASTRNSLSHGKETNLVDYFNINAILKKIIGYILLRQCNFDAEFLVRQFEKLAFPAFV